MKNLKIELFKETYSCLKAYRFLAEQVGEQVGERSEAAREKLHDFHTLYSLLMRLELEEEYLEWREKNE